MLRTIFRKALTDTWTVSADGDPVGCLRIEDGNWYKCVKSSGALDFEAKDIVYYVTDTGPAASTVTATVSESTDIGAGAAMAAVTLTDVFFWIQLTGVIILNTTLSAGSTAGDAVTGVGANNLTLDVLTTADESVHLAIVVTDSTDTVILNFPIFGTS